MVYHCCAFVAHVVPVKCQSYQWMTKCSQVPVAVMAVTLSSKFDYMLAALGELIDRTFLERWRQKRANR